MAATLDIQCAHGTRSFRVCLNLPEYLAACLIFRKLCSAFTYHRSGSRSGKPEPLSPNTTALAASAIHQISFTFK